MNNEEILDNDLPVKEKSSEEKLYELELNAATQGKRLANYLIDLVFIYLYSMFFGFLLGLLLGLCFKLGILSPVGVLSFQRVHHILFSLLLGGSIVITYYLIFEGATGRSPAKFITKTKVIDHNGDKPNFKKIVIRSLCRCIPFEAFSFLGSNLDGWHDRFSQTLVVNKDPQVE